MRVQSQTEVSGEPVPAHSAAVFTKFMSGCSAPPGQRGRHVEVSSGRGVHVIEAGDGVPVVFLHGSSTSSLSLLPVLERLEGVRSIAVDRPGFGLSEPAPVPRARFREAAVEVSDEIVEELELDSLALAGNSMGGTWALWYAARAP